MMAHHTIDEAAFCTVLHIRPQCTHCAAPLCTCAARRWSLLPPLQQHERTDPAAPPPARPPRSALRRPLPRPPTIYKPPSSSTVLRTSFFSPPSPPLCVPVRTLEAWPSACYSSRALLARLMMPAGPASVSMTSDCRASPCSQILTLDTRIYALQRRVELFF